MRFKLNLLIFLLVTVVLVGSGTLSYYALRADLNTRFEERKQALAGRLRVSLDNALWNYDKVQAASVVDAELESPEVFEIRLYRAEKGTDVLWILRDKGGVFSSAGAGFAERAARVSANEEMSRIPLYVHSRALPSADMTSSESDKYEGYAQVVFSRQSVDWLLAEQLRNRFLEIAFLNLILGLALFYITSRLFVDPLAQLSKAFKDLAKNPQARTLALHCEDEFGEVVEAFNRIERRLVSDIEKRTEAENKLRQSNEELLQALDHLQQAQDSLVQSEKFASLGSLVAGVAHEINTPVGVAVSGASFLLDQVQKTAKQVQGGAIRKSELLEFIDAITEGSRLVLSNVERAAHLIQSFKQVAADETSEERRHFDLRAYLDEVLTSLRPKYKKRKIKVSLDCPEDIEMDTYPGLLAQVLSNLLINALTHGFDADAQGQITIRATPEGAWVSIECYNDGKVIPPQYLGRIFDPFFTTRRSEGGTGLGLNIVFNIVTQRLRGSVTVHSAEGEGTSFLVRIPRIVGL